MKTKQRLLSMLVALVMVLGVFAPVLAAEVGEPTGVIQNDQLTPTRPEKTTLVIHKLQADSYKNDAPWDHTGGPWVTRYKCKRTSWRRIYYYKVSAEQLETMKANPANYDTTTKMQGAGHTAVGSVTTTENGVNVELEEGYYWFVESGKPDSVSSALAVPFGISLPIASGSQYLSTVHIYPKNITGDEPEPEKTVDSLTNKYSSHNVGDTQTWYLQATIPGNIGDYGHLAMTDTFSPSLSYVGNVEVRYGTGTEFADLATQLVLNEDYRISQPAVGDKGGTREIVYTEAGIAKLAANYVEGGKLVAKVDTVINEDAIMGLDIPNSYTLIFNNNPNNEGDPKEKPSENNPKVVTGGKRFQKVDGQTPLAGAIFQLFDGETAVNWTAELITANKAAIDAGKFATEANGEYTATSGTNQPEAGQPIYLRSDNTGEFEIKGLELSEWQPLKWDAAQNAMVNNGDPITHDWNLVEVQAPEGYAILKDAHKFEITKTSYQKDPENLDLGLADPDLIQNSKLTIPQTGGMGTILFVLVGLGLMGGALVAMKRRNESEQF